MVLVLVVEEHWVLEGLQRKAKILALAAGSGEKVRWVVLEMDGS